MKHWIAFFVLAVFVSGCRVKPAAAHESVAEHYYHPYGFSLSRQEWDRRGRTGKVVSNLKDGSVETLHYEKGVRHGAAEWSFPYSTLTRRSAIYEYGRTAQMCEHYNDGSPKSQTRYLAQEERQVTSWYPDGVPQAQERWQGERLLEGSYFSHEGQLQSSVHEGAGKRLEYQGYTLVARAHYQDGQLFLCEELYPSGEVAARIPYQDGKQHGRAEYFDEQGALTRTEEWNRGVQQGLTVEYLKGQKIAEVPYVGGQKQGQEQRYRAGELIETIGWQAGKRMGPHKLFSDRELVKIEYYYYDSPVAKATFERIAREKQKE